jgi:membrane protease subunit (stomatin/prohibitin family)
MSLWGKLTGEFVDIVEWTEDAPDVLVHRFERYNNEIKMGAQLTVREGQLAIMVNEGQMGKGQAADVFQPGMYTLSTQNLPLLSTLQGWKFGFDSPFRAEVYFFNTRLFANLKWGTPGPAMMRDPEFGVVRVSAFGIYSIRVHDPKIVLRDLVGTKAVFTTEDIEENLRGKVSTKIKEAMPGLGVPVIDLNSKISVLGDKLKEVLAKDFGAMGFELNEVQVQSISLPEEVEKAIDQQGAMKAIGNMNQFAQYQAAQAMRDAANNQGAAGAMMGIGVGGMLNQGMGGLFNQGGQQQQPQGGFGGGGMQQPAPQQQMAPPPLPTAVKFFAAIGGAQAGPFDLGQLRQQLQSGAMNKDTLVWHAGMPGWTPAGTVGELAPLFSELPPPLPPPLPR